MKEYLAICPAGIVACLAPGLACSRVCHNPELATRGLKFGSQESASCVNVRCHFPPRIEPYPADYKDTPMISPIPRRLGNQAAR